MKSMDEYMAELDFRIDEKKTRTRAGRRRLVAACAALALCLCAFGAWRIAAGTDIKNVELTPGKTAELALDRKDRFVEGKLGSRYEKNEKAEPDITAYWGPVAFDTENGVLFTLLENGPIYTISDGEVGHMIGTLPIGARIGAAYYNGGVYVPATGDVICGWTRKKGICRYDIETRETKCVIAADEEVSSLLVLGDNLIYASAGDRNAVIKLCDLKTGRIYRVAELSAPESEEYYPAEARICLCGEGLAALYKGRVSLVSFEGEIKTLCEGAEAISAAGDRLYAFRGVTKLMEEREEVPIRRLKAEAVEVFSAETGGSMGQADIGEYALSCRGFGSDMSFTVHEGRLVAVKEGKALLLDPVTGEEEKLLEGMPEYAAAASLGDKLLLLSGLGKAGEDYAGSVYLIGNDGSTFSGELPTGLNSHRDTKLIYDSIGEAQAELLFEKADIPIAFDKLENAAIYGWGRVNTSYMSGERREKNMGNVLCDAEYKGKKLNVSIWQEPNDDLGTFMLKLGYGELVESKLFGADELPVREKVTDGVLCYDLIFENGEPMGVMSLFEDNAGNTVDIEARLLRESKSYRTVVTLVSEGLTAEELRELIKN